MAEFKELALAESAEREKVRQRVRDVLASTIEHSQAERAYDLADEITKALDRAGLGYYDKGSLPKALDTIVRGLRIIEAGHMMTDEEWLEDHRDQQVQREAAHYADPEVTRG